MLRSTLYGLTVALLAAMCHCIQSSRLEIEHSWPGGMTANICIDHDMNIDCGWEMEIVFSKSVPTFEIWSAVVKSKTATKVVIRNVEWSQSQEDGACHRFNAGFNSRPSATAVYTKICSEGVWTNVGSNGGGSGESGSDSGEATPGPLPAGEPDEPNYKVYILSSWKRGLYGEICLFHTSPITCGFDAEIIFRGPIKKLEIWSMAIVDELRTSNEVRYLLTNMQWGKKQPNNPVSQAPREISGHYIRTCHNGEDNFDPNQGGTVQPPTTTTISTTTSTTTSTPSTTTSAPTTSSTTTSTSAPTSSSTTTPTPASTTISTATTTMTSSTSTTEPTTEDNNQERTTTISTVSTTTTTNTSNNLQFDYYDSLRKSMLFYFVQRSGPINDNIIPWRTADSAVNDGSDVGRDLVGGWYDAGDHVKFNFPMAGSTTTLLWGFLQWPDAYVAAGKLDMMYELIKHPLDYFLKCWDNENQILYGQVSNGHIDHATWGRPEDMQMDRPAFFLEENKGGSDLAGETAAAMAAGALAFQSRDPGYATQLLQAAEQVYAFADEYKTRYHYSIPNAADFYTSYSGYNDELCWGAAWLLKVTGKEDYRDKARTAMAGMSQSPQEYSWDDKSVGCLLLMHEMSSGQEQADYRARIADFLNRWVNFQNHVRKTGCGLAWLRRWGSLRYAANAALIALTAADQGIEPTSYRAWAEKQIKYMLGANNQRFSYQVGFGNSFPLRPHHQSATCPLGPAPCDWNTFSDPSPNAHELTGALVGGPDENDGYTDDRTDYVKNEVTTDYNAGFQSTLAGLIHLHQTGGLPDAAPVCSGL